MYCSVKIGQRVWFHSIIILDISFKHTFNDRLIWPLGYKRCSQSGNIIRAGSSENHLPALNGHLKNVPPLWPFKLARILARDTRCYPRLDRNKSIARTRESVGYRVTFVSSCQVLVNGLLLLSCFSSSGTQSTLHSFTYVASGATGGSASSTLAAMAGNQTNNLWVGGNGRLITEPCRPQLQMY